MTYRIVGNRGEATAVNFVEPHLDDRVVVTTAAGQRVEELGRRSSYTFQLEALAAHLREGAPLPIVPRRSGTRVTGLLPLVLHPRQREVL